MWPRPHPFIRTHVACLSIMIGLISGLALTARAAPATQPTPTPSTPAALPVAADAPARLLLENVRIFDGRADFLTEPMNVLVKGNTIKSISAGAIAVP